MNKHFILKYISLLALPMLLGLTSCHSGDQEFPDFGSTSVYFANQGYVRTIELGEDLKWISPTTTTMSSVSTPPWVEATATSATSK